MKNQFGSLWELFDELLLQIFFLFDSVSQNARFILLRSTDWVLDTAQWTVPSSSHDQLSYKGQFHLFIENSYRTLLFTDHDIAVTIFSGIIFMGINAFPDGYQCEKGICCPMRYVSSKINKTMVQENFCDDLYIWYLNSLKIIEQNIFALRH